MCGCLTAGVASSSLVFAVCFVGGGFYDGIINHSEEFCRGCVCVSNLCELETSKGGIGPIWPEAPQIKKLQPKECNIVYGCHDLKRSVNIKSRMLKRFCDLTFFLFFSFFLGNKSGNYYR